MYRQEIAGRHEVVMNVRKAQKLVMAALFMMLLDGDA
jgi:hypothetical protein